MGVIKKICNLISRINFYNIFESIIHCFITSCGIILLFAFFTYGKAEITFDAIKAGVIFIFVVLYVLRFTLEILTPKKSWTDLSEQGNIEYAVCVNEKENDNKMRIDTVHEAGHAIMAYLKEYTSFTVYTDNVQYRNITTYMNADNVKDYIHILYSGAVAEELIFGQHHNGCMGSVIADFEKARAEIRKYIIMTDPTVSKSMIDEEIAGQIISYSKEFYKDTTDILSKYSDLITVIAKELEKKKTLTKDEIAIFFTKETK